MNNMIQRSILFLGVAVAIGLLICNFSYAESNAGKSMDAIESESLQLAMDIVLSMDSPQMEEIQKVKVFNDAGQLIYEGQNTESQKLEQLLKKSDFLTEINDISYYKLSR